MKPPIATLRLDGPMIAIYMEDLINVGLTFDECVKNVTTFKKLLNSLEFIFHPDKSLILPKQEIIFLRFNINSQKKKVTFTDIKKQTLKAYYSELLHRTNQTTRYVAKVICLMTSSLPGVKYGAAHYKYLEQDKTNALKISKGCFDVIMILSSLSITDIQWWYNKINFPKNNITKGEPAIEILSDAGSFGWKAFCNNIRTGGTFNHDEMEYHINAKELLTAKFSPKTFVKFELCHSIISEIWAWAEDKNILITASYIPGKENFDADTESRKKTK